MYSNQRHVTWHLSHACHKVREATRRDLLKDCTSMDHINTKMCLKDSKWNVPSKDAIFMCLWNAMLYTSNIARHWSLQVLVLKIYLFVFLRRNFHLRIIQKKKIGKKCGVFVKKIFPRVLSYLPGGSLRINTLY